VTELETNGELISTSRWKWNAVCSIVVRDQECGNTYIQGGLVFEGGGNYCIFTLMNEPRVFPYIAWNLCLICTMSTSARDTITRVRVCSSVPRPYSTEQHCYVIYLRALSLAKSTVRDVRGNENIYQYFCR